MNGPLPSPSATGVRIAGDHYQWQLAWLACLGVVRDALTHQPNPSVRVGVEVDDAGNLDDVVVFRQDPPHTYQQVKYTVDASTPVNFAYLAAPSPKGGPSILAKINSTRTQLGQTAAGLRKARMRPSLQPSIRAAIASG